jgi:hypothetical protein
MGGVDDPARFAGAVTALDGTQIAARVASSEEALSLTVSLTIAPGGSATGTLRVVAL